MNVLLAMADITATLPAPSAGTGLQPGGSATTAQESPHESEVSINIKATQVVGHAAVCHREKVVLVKRADLLDATVTAKPRVTVSGLAARAATERVLWCAGVYDTAGVGW